MPLLGDITIAKSYFQSHISTPGARTLLHNKILFGNDKMFAYGWNLFQVPEKEKNFHVTPSRVERSVLQISAVSTVERIYSIQINGGKGVRQNHLPGVEFESTLERESQCSGDESEEVDDKEKLRRKRISKANSGKTPWNKGRKHSAETKQRIKERTRMAMQNPKVKMKLANLGHSQSEETRVKIGVSVRTMWERRREKLTVQETCRFEWQNLIAEASRRGFNKDEELEWDSYEELDKELEQEWLESIEQRKRTPRPKGHTRAPKPLEQRKKIAAAIAAKWADPTYRDRVQSALSKYHSSPARAERQPKRRPSEGSQKKPRPPRPIKKKIKDTNSKSVKTVKGTRLRKRNVPLYKDPFASAKLEMIKNIKAQRVAAGTNKSQALEQAKLMIAEAEKAAKALEEAALRSPLALASLSETRNLIAEAIQSIQSIEIPQSDYFENNQIKTYNGSVNGTLSTESFDNNIKDFGFGEFNFKELVKGEIEDPYTSYSSNGLLNKKEEYNIPGLNGHVQVNGYNKPDKAMVTNGARRKFEKKEINSESISVSKKWICGRLVEVVEGDTVSV